MAKGINKVILIGNLGNDPDSRTTPQGSAVTNLSIATDESYKDKQTGQMVPKTEWHRVVLFNRLGEIARDYLKKGSKVYIEGKLQTRKWQDQNSGQDRYSTEIIANELQMLDSRSDNAPAQQTPPPQAQAQAQRSPMGANPRGPQYQQQAPAPQAAPADDFDDDIPFMRIMDTCAF